MPLRWESGWTGSDAYGKQAGTPHTRQTRFIGGASYQINPQLRVLADWDYVSYQIVPVPPDLTRSELLGQMQLAFRVGTRTCNAQSARSGWSGVASLSPSISPLIASSIRDAMPSCILSIGSADPGDLEGSKGSRTVGA